MQEAIQRVWTKLVAPRLPKGCPDLIVTASNMYSRTSCRLLVLVLVHAAGCHPHLYQASSCGGLLLEEMPDGSTVHSALLEQMKAIAQEKGSPLPHRSLINKTICSLSAVPSVLRDQRTGFQKNAERLEKKAIELVSSNSSSCTFLVVVAPEDGGQPLTYASEPLVERLKGDLSYQKVIDAFSHH